MEIKKEALISKSLYEKTLNKCGFGKITTEIVDFVNYYYAEDYHQQYLLKNPLGYCGLGGCNVNFEKNNKLINVTDFNLCYESLRSL